MKIDVYKNVIITDKILLYFTLSNTNFNRFTYNLINKCQFLDFSNFQNSIFIF